MKESHYQPIKISLKEKRYFKNRLLNWLYKALIRLHIKEMEYCWECPKCKKTHEFFTDPCVCGWKHLTMYQPNKSKKPLYDPLPFCHHGENGL